MVHLYPVNSEISQPVYQAAPPPKAHTFPTHTVLACVTAGMAVGGALFGISELFDGPDVPEIGQGSIEHFQGAAEGRNWFERFGHGANQDLSDGVEGMRQNTAKIGEEFSKLGQEFGKITSGIGNFFSDQMLLGVSPELREAIEQVTVQIDPKNIPTTLGDIDNLDAKSFLENNQAVAEFLKGDKNVMKFGDDLILRPRDDLLIFLDQSKIAELSPDQQALLSRIHGNVVQPPADYSDLTNKLALGALGGAGVGVLATQSQEQPTAPSVQTPYSGIANIPTTRVDNISYQKMLANNPYVGHAV